jgi:hypothetical protein
MKLSINVGDEVYYRGGKTTWTVLEAPDLTNKITAKDRWFTLVNLKTGIFKTAEDFDLKLIFRIEKNGFFDVVIEER